MSRKQHISFWMKTVNPKLLTMFITLLLFACGGGDSDEKKPIASNRLIIFFVSGHQGTLDARPSNSYLDMDAGPSIVGDLTAAGYAVEPHYYVDDAFPVQGVGGYLQLVADLRKARDDDVPHGVRVLVIAHSHGGVWAHAAVRQVSDLTVTAQVDLDSSSYGWDVVNHSVQNIYIEGDPRNRFTKTSGSLATCPAYPSVLSELTPFYDLEDVISNNVIYALEVRSGDGIGEAYERYDEKWNIRENGTTYGIYCYFSNSTHHEVHAANGSTINVVRTWLRSRLSGG